MDITVHIRFCQVIWLQLTSTSPVQCIKLHTSLVYKWVLLSMMGCAAFSIPVFFQDKSWEGRTLLKTFSLGCRIEILNSECESESPTGLQKIQMPRLYLRLSKLLIGNLKVGNRDIYI